MNKQYSNLSETKKVVILFVAIVVVNFVSLRFILELVSNEMDPANPRAHMEKVLKEFI